MKHIASLKKLGSFEFFQTSFSYIDQETGEERYVGVPEEGGRNVIASDPFLWNPDRYTPPAWTSRVRSDYAGLRPVVHEEPGS